MFRSNCVSTALTVALCLTVSAVCLSDSLIAQEDPPAGQQPAAGFTPTAVVQDEGSLTDKASFFVGFKMMKDLNKQKAGEVNMQELFAGMKSAAAGEDRKSFIAGYQMMSDFEQRGFGLKLEKMFEGMTTASSGKELGMTDEEVKSMMMAFQKVVEKRQIEKMKKTSADNVAAAEVFMAKNAAENPNVKTLPNGVQYEIQTEGTGPVPTAANTVKVDYHGTFLDGTVFDSSIDPPSGQAPTPAEFKVTEVVPGFSAVLQSMKVGSKWRVVIPGQQAYGARGGARGLIGPNQALVFEISLLAIIQ
jgi:FKBP-type peptidyl-prolyl cis-trans isomerase